MNLLRLRPAMLCVAVAGVFALSPVYAADEAVLAQPGAPQAHADAQGGQFGNAALQVQWQGVPTHFQVTDRAHGQSLTVDAPFVLEFAGRKKITASDMQLLSPASVQDLPVDAHASRLAERLPGKQVSAVFGDAAGRFKVEWKLAQREGSAYLRETVTVTALKQDEPLSAISLLTTKLDHVLVDGSTQGSPVVAGDWYLGLENPLANNEIHFTTVHLAMPRSLPLRKGQAVTYSAVLGVARDGQLRRDFATYVERERAHPYRPFLHYNSWYDIGYFTPYTEAEAVQRIHAFGEALSVKRGVKLDSFLFDDGWDDRSGSWGFSKDFPHGFAPLRAAAAEYGAAPGMWLSPWGGYGKPKDERVAGGTAKGYEIIDDGLALSGPKYYQRFHQVVMNLLDQDGVNQFKFDGTGNASTVVKGSQFDSDFAAAISLIDDIRHTHPDTFINLSTGTWASPFWLRYVDDIWRGGEDDWHAGVGSEREQWITYRDQQTYENIVVPGPLYPLNSLMLHGIIYAQKNTRLNTDPGNDFANEVHSYFATGTDLQELYITPSLLTEANWDTLANSAKWARNNADVLRDSHWVGGDPGRLQVYGWAAWSPRKAIITLRNPDARAQNVVIDLQRQLELPADAARRYTVHDLWQSGGIVPGTLDADHPVTITLAPFEVLTLELSP